MPYVVQAKNETVECLPDSWTRINRKWSKAVYGYRSYSDASYSAGEPCTSCHVVIDTGSPVLVEYCGETACSSFYCKHCGIRRYKDSKRPETQTRFCATDRATVFEYLKTHYQTSTHCVSFISTVAELTEWRQREERLFESGAYFQTPWHRRQKNDLRDIHFVHISVNDPTKVAYTPDIEHGITNKQIRLTPGRYLERFYADVFTKAEIAAYVAQVLATDTKFAIATTVADIRSVYRNGPASCMGGSCSHTNQYWRERNLDDHLPVEVYAHPSDLAIAYYGPITKPSQRTVIWPAKKRYVRIYGTGPLQYLLERDGYALGDLTDARIRAIEVNGDDLLMPYIDGIGNASLCRDGKFIVLDDNGPLDCQVTSGSVSCAGYGRPQPDEDNDDDNQTACSHCGDYCPDDDLENGFCAARYARLWTCVDCNEYQISTRGRVDIVDHGYICGSCAEDRHVTCASDNCVNRWIEENVFTTEQTTYRREHDLSTYCYECAEQRDYCQACDRSFDTAQHSRCPDCDRETAPIDHPELPIVATTEPAISNSYESYTVRVTARTAVRRTSPQTEREDNNDAAF